MSFIYLVQDEDGNTYENFPVYHDVDNNKVRKVVRNTLRKMGLSIKWFAENRENKKNNVIVTLKLMPEDERHLASSSVHFADSLDDVLESLENTHK